MRDFIDGCGVMFVACHRLTQGHIYYGDPLYSRWYGFYKADRRVIHKLKMLMRNGKG